MSKLFFFQKESSSIKTVDIELALMLHFNFKQNLVIPNVTEASSLVGFETDILSLSKNGYATGVEIKVSKGDLKNDLKKKHISRLSDPKADWKSIYFKRFKQFYYAVPSHLVEDALDQVPSFCGILEVFSGEFRPIVREVRGPELLFKTKWSDGDRFNLMRIGCMRIYALKQNLNKSTSKNK